MKPFTRVLSAFAVGILLQGGIYLYLDQYMFAPTTEFNVAGASKDDTKNFPDVKAVSYTHLDVYKRQHVHQPFYIV